MVKTRRRKVRNSCLEQTYNFLSFYHTVRSSSLAWH
jgi:hypothetical protein